jgi:GST-like protein
MIQLYTHATPNGHKISIMLEEVGLPYDIHLVELVRGAQYEPEFLRINPNAKIPAIIDPDGPGCRPLTLWESGAILIYLAEKTGSALLPSDPRERYVTLQWLMFQVANVGPMWGQVGHFTLYSKQKIEYGIERYTKESRRILGVLQGQLATNRFVAGGEYTIADIAIYPWTNSILRIPTIGGLDEWPAIVRWREEVGSRPAVQRGLQRPKRDN